MKIPKINDITSADQARQLAIDWSNWQGEQSLSYGELNDWHTLFEELERQYPELSEEFEENAII
jgi:hypothetical protein